MLAVNLIYRLVEHAMIKISSRDYELPFLTFLDCNEGTKSYEPLKSLSSLYNPVDKINYWTVDKTILSYPKANRLTPLNW
jgi:hypothetical protein